MNRQFRIFLLVFFILILFCLNYLLTGEIFGSSGQESIWLHSGLLTLIIGNYWIENYFTKPSDVVINGLIVFISLSTLENPPNESWWSILKYYALILMIISFIVVWIGSPAISEYDTSFFKKIIYLIVIRLGNARVLYSFVFLLALISFFDISTNKSKILLAFWAVVLSAKYLEIETLIDKIILYFKRPKVTPIGHISRNFEPNIIRINLLNERICKKGSIIAFTENGQLEDDSPLGIIIGQRTKVNAVELESMLFDSNFKYGKIDKRSIAIKIDPDDEKVKKRLLENAIFPNLDNLIGFASKNTSISKLMIEFIKPTDLEEGHLVSITIDKGREVLFQIIEGKLSEEISLENNERSFTIGEAQQLGEWIEDKQGFEIYSWVIKENSPVFQVKKETEVNKIIKENIIDVGYIPNSNFPININLKNLILFHTAILGVTGSGKSFLAYHLIEECIKAGIKVVCLDVTGDYKRYLNNPVLLNRKGALDKYLEINEKKIGIVEFLDDKIHPISAANIISSKLLHWCKKNRKPEEVKEPTPKVLLVLEEAHTLVPEWNSNPERRLQDTVNNTAQITLQARKYGLGFMVITQRTANVTKSILNQCNTIFAFQAYDETGFDFMKNYMGQNYVNALPNLKKRQGVLVGKASVSDHPCIVRFYDQDRDAKDNTVEELIIDEDTQSNE